jgi:hypothetical protein
MTLNLLRAYQTLMKLDTTIEERGRPTTGVVCFQWVDFPWEFP